MMKIGKHIFSHILMNMDFSLIIGLTVTGMKTAMHAAKTHLEGKVSQNFDKGLRFCSIVRRQVNFKKNAKITKVI